MARLNEAYRVLGDPARRAVYDAAVREAAVGSAAGGAGVAQSAAPVIRAVPRPPTDDRPVRFPWRFCLVLASLGAGVVLVIAALASQAPPKPIDHVLEPGSCVVLIETDRSAGEVPCDDFATFRVSRMVAFGSACPAGTQGYRDRNGVGTACVERIPADE